MTDYDYPETDRAKIVDLIQAADRFVEVAAGIANLFPNDGHPAAQTAAWSARREAWDLLNQFDNRELL